MMEITSVFSDTKGLGELSDEAGNSWEENQHELKGQFTTCLETKKWSSKWDLFFLCGDQIILIKWQHDFNTQYKRK